MHTPWVLITITLCTAAAVAGDDAIRTNVAIVGAGPAGLQLAHYLKTAGTPFVLIDASPPGSFFSRFPRHRQLISINKRVPPSRHLDSALRHDWNSLLSDPSHLAPKPEGSASVGASDAWQELTRPLAHPTVQNAPNLTLFRHYTRDFFPHADVLSRFLRDFEQRLDLTPPGASSYVSLLGWRVVSARRRPAASCENGGGTAWTCFELHLESSVTNATAVVFAKRVVAATGLSKAAPLSLRAGQHLVDTYETAPTDAEEYSNQRVLILGRGNAAFEVAALALQSAAIVHIAGRAGARIRPAWETHYPGDIRLTHAQLLESYLLKSGDGLIEVDMNALGILRGPHGGLQVTSGIPAELEWRDSSAQGVPVEPGGSCQAEAARAGEEAAGGGQHDDPDAGNSEEGVQSRRGATEEQAVTGATRGADMLAELPGAGATRGADMLAELPKATHCECAATKPAAAAAEAGLLGVAMVPEAVQLTWDPVREDGERAVQESRSPWSRVTATVAPAAAASPIPPEQPLGSRAAAAEAPSLGDKAELDSLWSRREYDRIVVCTGWGFDDSWLDGDALPARAAINKFPAVTARYESVNVPGLFFAGALAHSVDWKRSAGGFVHGFRYTVRALHRILAGLDADEETWAATVGGAAEAAAAPANESRRVLVEGQTVPSPLREGRDAADHRGPAADLLPSSRGGRAGALEGDMVSGATLTTRPPLAVLAEPRPVPPEVWPTTQARGVGTAARHLLHRMATSSGLYQMFGALCDVVLLPPPWELRRAREERLGADSARGRHPQPARRRLPLLRRPSLPLPAQGAGWDESAAESVLNDALPAARSLLAQEVPAALAPLLARRMALAAWTNATAADWAPSPRDLRELGGASGAAGRRRGSSRALPAETSAAFAAARRQAIAAWGGADMQGGTTLGFVAERSRALYQPVPAAPLAEEEAWLDAQWGERLQPPREGHRGGGGTGDEDGGCAGASWPPAICYLTLTLEYGHEHHEPGTDPFSLARAVTEAALAAESQFLHPVIRLWRVAAGADPRQVLKVRLNSTGSDWRPWLNEALDEAEAKQREGPWRSLEATVPLTVTSASRGAGGAGPSLSDIAHSPSAVFESHIMEDFLAELDQPYHMEAAAYALKNAMWPL